MDATNSTQPIQHAASAGDALEAAFAQYQNELLGALYYWIGNTEDARDAMQETFIKCWRHRDKLSEIRQLRSWIFRVAVNTARDMRQTAYRRRRQTLADDGQSLLDRTTEPAEQIVQQEQLMMLQQAIMQLRPEEKEVFLLRQNGAMTYEEIAVALQLPSGTVKTRMRMAIVHLRNNLE